MLLASTCSTRSMPKHSRSAQTAHGVAYAVCNNGCLADGRALKSVHLSVKSNLVAHGWAHIMYLHARTQEQGPSHLRTLYMYSCNTPPPPAVFLSAVFSALLVRALAYQNAQRTAHREISSGVEGGRGGSVVVSPYAISASAIARVPDINLGPVCARLACFVGTPAINQHILQGTARSRWARVL